MITYDVTVTRDGDLWVAVPHGLPHNTSGAIDAEHLTTLHGDMADVIADLTDTDSDDIAIRWRYEINGRDVTDALQRFLAIESEINERIAAREAARRDAIQTLTDAGLSRRATGDAVGLSGGRVQQLMSC